MKFVDQIHSKSISDPWSESPFSCQPTRHVPSLIGTRCYRWQTGLALCFRAKGSTAGSMSGRTRQALSRVVGRWEERMRGWSNTTSEPQSPPSDALPRQFPRGSFTLYCLQLRVKMATSQKYAGLIILVDNWAIISLKTGKTFLHIIKLWQN